MESLFSTKFDFIPAKNQDCPSEMKESVLSLFKYICIGTIFYYRIKNRDW